MIFESYCIILTAKSLYLCQYYMYLKTVNYIEIVFKSRCAGLRPINLKTTGINYILLPDWHIPKTFIFCNHAVNPKGAKIGSILLFFMGFLVVSQISKSAIKCKQVSWAPSLDLIEVLNTYSFKCKVWPTYSVLLYNPY